VLGLRLTDRRDPATSPSIGVSFGPDAAPGALNLSLTAAVAAPVPFAWRADPGLRDAYAARLQAAGVAVRRTAASISFPDPDGNELAITSWRWAVAERA
jgi:hypothetical protein